MPGGHLATSLALGAAAFTASGSVEAAVGCVAGGFFIDVDHYLDYLIFEKQWRQPSPLRFLSYYFRNSPKRLVLPLHSLELMTLLLVGIAIYPVPLLVGYWLGALMHLVFDVLVNGDYALKRPVLFYIFSYRASHRFSADALMDVVTPDAAGRTPIREFFRWYPVQDSEEPLVAEAHRRLAEGARPTESHLELLEVKVDHRGNVEREELRDQKAAHNCQP